jgi:8-oxo-dGTP pyrophosphatase MutT (NUDIX family)
MVDTFPDWWAPFRERVTSARTEDFTRLTMPPEGGRPSAVLVLFAEETPGDPDVLVLQRAARMRTHAGQPAFPGGAADPGETDPVDTALREAAEEVGLDPTTVDVQALLPPLFIPVSGFAVTPVLAWWRKPHPVAPVDFAEVESVHRVRIAELVDPANRVRVRHPSGWVGAAFHAGDMLIWGFTAGILTALLDMSGWALPWDSTAPPEPLP